LNFDHDTCHLGGGVCGFTQSLKTYPRILPQLGHIHFQIVSDSSFLSFPISQGYLFFTTGSDINTPQY